MPNARPRRRGQAPQPRSGAPKAQGLTAAAAVAAPSNVPSFARKSTGTTVLIATATTPPIYTTLTDVTRLHSEMSYKRLDRGRFVWPQTVDGVVSLTAGQVSYLLEGIDWRNPQQTWRPRAAG